MKPFFFFTILLFGSLATKAQINYSTIDITGPEDSATGRQQIEIYRNRYFVDGQQLDQRQLERMLSDNKAARNLYQKAKGRSTWGIILGTAGGITIGTALANGVYDNPALVPTLIFGAGLFGGGLVIASGADSKAREAIDVYNAGLSTVNNTRRKEWLLSVGAGNLSLVCKF